MSIPRRDFLNPSDELPAPARAVVDALLASVSRAHARYGDATAQDVEFAALDLAAVRERLANGYSVTHVVEARVRLTIAASLNTHCLTAFPYTAALDKARAFDEQIAQNGASAVLQQFPLLGLVFSVKDCIHVRGFATTLGCSSRAGTLEPASARVVEELERVGAVMVAKTAAPQLMMSNTTASPLWGTVRSALGAQLEAGGSSGGEAALVRYGGSQLGLGTDMGGSVRQPAALAELFGFKLHANHLAWDLPRDFMTGLPETRVPATAPGFFTRQLSTLRDVCRALNLVREPTQAPHIRWTCQEASRDIAALVRAASNGSTQLGAIDSAYWGEVWTSFATHAGFGPARTMLATDPLIRHTMFDEHALEPTPAPVAHNLQEIRRQFAHFAAIDASTPTILVTPTHMVGPCSRDVFRQADATGVAEVWCQIFNLLDWPALSIPLEHVGGTPELDVSNAQARELLDALQPQQVTDPHTPDQPRRARLSIQLATPPGNEAALLALAHKLTAQ